MMYDASEIHFMIIKETLNNKIISIYANNGLKPIE